MTDLYLPLGRFHFNAIEKENPKAAELLLVCGFFHNEDICEELLRRGMKIEKHGTNLSEDTQRNY